MGVYQTAQTTPKSPTKWYNRTILHHTAWCSAVYSFIIRKPHKPHHNTPHPLYILIYLIIFNIKYIINSLITLVFKKKKSLITLINVDYESHPNIKKNQFNSLKLEPKQREKLVLDLVEKARNLKNIQISNHSNCILYTAPHM